MFLGGTNRLTLEGVMRTTGLLSVGLLALDEIIQQGETRLLILSNLLVICT